MSEQKKVVAPVVQTVLGIQCVHMHSSVPLCDRFGFKFIL